MNTKALALILVIAAATLGAYTYAVTYQKINNIDTSAISRLGNVAAASIAQFPSLITPPTPPAAPTFFSSTELIDFVGMTAGESQDFLDECDALNIPEVVLRIPSYTDYSDGAFSATYKATCSQIITQADVMGIDVWIDLHTWYTTWDSSFDDSATGYAAKRATYLTYIQDAINDMAGDNVSGWYVLNEPQAQYATSGEISFILSCISTAKALTTKPVGVRFMGGYSPATGRYSTAIWQASDFCAINTYWNPSSPITSVYGVNENVMTNTIALAESMNRDLYITEFGKTSTGTAAQNEAQRVYVETFVTWASGEDIAKVFGWASDPETNDESYNLWSAYTPRPAWYELMN